MQFKLAFFIVALAPFVTASPIEQNINQKNVVNAKCFSGCGPSQAVVSVTQATWSSGLIFGNQPFNSFSQLTQGFQSFGTICANTFSQWSLGGFQFQQISVEIHTMVIQFQAMISQFSNAGGCNLCNPTFGSQFVSAIGPVFQQFQTMITIITQSYGSFIGQIQPDFNILYSCLRIVTGILVSLNINVSGFLANIGIDLNIFSNVGINIQVLLSLDVTSLFSGHGLLSPVGNVLNGVLGGLL
ncbi:secreted protein [Melampsora americana]|nr:secreted protein [Melampsora americana]